jgi:hypothetical protein
MKNELQNLNNLLEHGDKRKLADQFSMSITAVSAHLNRKYKNINTELIEAAIRLVKERKVKEKKLVLKLKNL